MNKDRKAERPNPANAIRPAWMALMRHCQAMGRGEIERIKVRDFVPMLIEKSMARLNLTWPDPLSQPQLHGPIHNIRWQRDANA